MSTPSTPPSSRPASAEERFRLYIDESGDHVFQQLDKPSCRHLCLLGCWFKRPAYDAFHEELETLKKEVFKTHPDEPLVFHREDMINRRRNYGLLRDQEEAESFDRRLLALIGRADFRICAVVIDKLVLWEQQGDTAPHPYHLALGVMLHRYCEHLNAINRCGDVLAEGRGGREDMLLKECYTAIHDGGVWAHTPEFFQQALTSKQLKVKKKDANIAGLQLADLLSHPCREFVLHKHGLREQPLAPFASRLIEAVTDKFHHHPDTGHPEDHGLILTPKR
jgi:Protein of unknown function (DUF3800)